MSCKFDLDIFDMDASFKKGKDSSDPKRRPHSKLRGLDVDDMERVVETIKKKYG